MFTKTWAKTTHLTNPWSWPTWIKKKKSINKTKTTHPACTCVCACARVCSRTRARVCCVCHNERKVPDERQARQAIPAILQVAATTLQRKILQEQEPVSSVDHCQPYRMKIAPLGLAGGRSYDRTNSLRTPTMKESQLLREKTTSSVFVSTCSNAVHAQFHWLAYTRNTRPCDVVCLQSKHFWSIAGMIAPPAKIYAHRSRSRWNMKHFRQTARGCLLHQ